MSRPVVTWPPPGATAQEVVADLSVLEAAMAGTGPAVAVPGALDRGDVGVTRVPDETAVVVATSGTTGRPKPALLPARALELAVGGVQDVLGGPGQSMLAVPPTHITGITVILRNLWAGFAPTAVTPGHFGPEAFVDLTRRWDPRAPRHYVTLVPTQLRRVLACPEAVAAAREYDTILVGAAPLPAADRDRALRRGLAIVDGYGCSETAGGCLYDGRPLPHVLTHLGEGGRIHLGGTQVALGYLDRPDAAGAFTTDADEARWYRTYDHGHRDATGRLVVDGRLDDLINSGGLKVAPTAVEDAIGLARCPGIAEAMVVGVPDPEWGEAVAVVAVPRQGATPGLDGIRACLADHLPSHALPRVLHLVASLPVRGPGKPDRVRARALAGAALSAR
ncbi:AMP-binding protein [Arsenicicoccus sp. oral taxon 190]|uniref:AMP-binding protein n=1 Tax=Arsenicicoccus sp. oral taxon 190 TaxID=1658671 RepID=UPI00067A15F4|nr:AMP-binding protein [Arsenicicoccus sp. oral taxon 190]AKT50484.1 hypothetical protein ADJ73_02665 [Arsenicicoccus sp. oral taxon 190]